MAFTLVTAQTILARNAGVLYGLELGTVDMAAYSLQMGTTTVAQAAFLNSVYAASVGTASVAVVAAQVVTGLGIKATNTVPYQYAIDYVTGQLNTAATTNTQGSTINTIINLFSGLSTTDATWGPLVIAFNNQITNALTFAGTTGSVTNSNFTSVPTTIAASTSSTFTLTTGLDTVTSAATIIEAVVDQITAGTNTTWNLTDNLSAAPTNAVVNLNLLSHANGANGSGRTATNIATLNIKVTDTADNTATASTFSLAGMTGLTTLNIANSAVSTGAKDITDTLTVSSLASTTALGINSNGQYQNVTVNGTDWTGAADALAITVTGRSGILTLGTTSAALESVAVTSVGTSARLEGLKTGTTATIKTVTITGTGIKIDGIMDSTITSLDASAVTGNVNVYLATASTLTSAKAGAGTADVLAVNSLSTTQIVSGFETIIASGTGTNTYILTNVTGATKLGVDARLVADGTVTANFSGAAATMNTIAISGGAQRTATASVGGNLVVGDIGYALTTATGTADALTLTIDNGGVASTSTTVGTLTVGTVTTAAIETVTVTAADFKAITLGGLVMAATGAAANTLTATATSANLNLGTIAMTHGSAATTADIINLSAVTGKTTETVSGLGALTFSGGTGIDTVTQSGTIAASSTQTYNLGAGNDVMTIKSALADGTTSILVVNGDAGDDTFTLDGNVTSVGKFTFNGGDGTDTLIVSGVADTKTLTSTISGIEKINFQTTGNNPTTFALTVAASYADTVLITNVGGTAAETIAVTSTGAVDLSNWTQLGMTVGTDIISLLGTGTLKGAGLYATTIVGSSSVDTITGGTAIDTITGGASVDSLTGGTGADTFIHLATTLNGIDAITDFQKHASGTDDVLRLSLTEYAGTTGTTGYFSALKDGNSAAVTAGATMTVKTVAAATTLAAGDRVMALTGATFLTAAAVQTAIEAAGSRALTFGSATTAGDDIIVLWSDGTNAHVSAVNIASAATTITAANSTVVDIVTLTGISSIAAADFTDANFAIVA